VGGWFPGPAVRRRDARMVLGRGAHGQSAGLASGLAARSPGGMTKGSSLRSIEHGIASERWRISGATASAGALSCLGNLRRTCLGSVRQVADARRVAVG
jgi:hypothetical protein